jgi:iron complex outermembrane receptor protein
MQVAAVVLSLLFILSSGASAAEIQGIVLDKDTGKPIAGAVIELPNAGEAVTTEPDGRFVVRVASEGIYLLRAVAEGFYPLLKRVSAPSPPVELVLEPVVSFREEIEVTPSRAERSLDPATFTNLSRERIDEAYFGQDPAMLLASTVPGLYAYNDNGNGIGYSYFTIRGFGQARSRVSLNGAPLNDAESGELFFIDLADFLATAGDIQVRRGVFGLSGLGGSVDITTAPAPSTLQPTLKLHVGIGSYDTQRWTVRYDSGLLRGSWALTARYSKITSDGYRDQSWVDMWNYFLSLSRFGEKSRVRLLLFGGPEKTHLAYYGIPKSVLEGGLTGDKEKDRRFNPLTYPGEIDYFYQPHFQIVSEHFLRPNVEYAQTLYLFQGDGYYDQFRKNRKLVEYNLPNIVLSDGTVIRRTDLVRRRSVDEWDAGWVPSLTMSAGKWRWEVTGEVRWHEGRHFGQVLWAQYYPPMVPPNRRYYDYQVRKFTGTGRVQASYPFGSRLRAALGLGFTQQEYEMSKDRLKDVSFTEKFRFLLPQVGLVWQINDTSEIYLNVARGMREPTFRSLYDPQDFYASRARLEPEDVWDWEAGWSIRREDFHGRVNAFLMRFANEIVWAGALNENGVPIYGNGARSTHRGIELEGGWTPTKRFSLDASLTLSRNTFTRYREFGYDGSVVSYDGNRIAGYPDRLVLVTARSELAGFRTALTLRAVDRFYLDNTEDNRKHPERREQPGYVPRVNPSYTVVDLGLRRGISRSWVKPLGLENLEFELRVQNLLNRHYTAFGYVEDGEPKFVPAADRNFYLGLTVTM